MIRWNNRTAIVTAAMFAALLAVQATSAGAAARGSAHRPESSSGNQYDARVLGSKPVAYWPLREKHGSVARDVFGRDPGAVKGGAGPLHSDPSPTGGGYRFDGSSGYISLGTPRNLFPQSWTIEAWFRSATVPSSSFCACNVIYRNRHYGQDLQINRHGDVSVDMFTPNGNATAVSGPSGYLDGAWHYVVASYQAHSPTRHTGELKLYLDGSLVQSRKTQGAGTYYSGSDGIAIGRDGSDPGGYFDGAIAAVAVYSHAVGKDQIRNHYLAALAQSAFGPTLNRLMMVGPSTGWALSSSWGITRTTDGGHTWSAVNPSGLAHSSLSACFGLAGATKPQGASAIFATGPKRAWLAASCATAGSHITVFSTSNAGRTWQSTSVDAGVAPTSLSLDFVGPTTGWMTAESTSGGAPSSYDLFSTHDSGRHWAPVTSTTLVDVVLGFAARTRGYGYSYASRSSAPAGTAGFSTFPAVTNDGGRTWSHVAVSAPHGFEKAFLTVGAAGFTGTALAAIPVTMNNPGAGGACAVTVYRTHDGGSSWTHGSLLNGCRGKAVTAGFLNAADGWVVFDHTVYGTSDGGSHWATLGIIVAFRGSFDFVSPGRGFVLASGRSGILQTADSGRSWSAYTPRLTSW